MNGFIAKFESNLSLDMDLVVRRENRYYLLNRQLKKLAPRDFFHAGTYLGKAKDGSFFPSFPLLTMMAKGEASRVMVDAKTEWLFICGRDIFKRGITGIRGSRQEGAHTLVLNEKEECLGFGRILRDPDKDRGRNQPTIRNILDIGDFLRRERWNSSVRRAHRPSPEKQA